MPKPASAQEVTGLNKQNSLNCSLSPLHIRSKPTDWKKYVTMMLKGLLNRYSGHQIWFGKVTASSDNCF